jgi:hypothetical protein
MANKKLMADKKLLLFVLFFMLAALIGGNPAQAEQINNSIDQASVDQAIAIIGNAIDEAIARIREALDDDPAQAIETVNDALAYIRDAVNNATVVIEEAIRDEINSVEEATEENFVSTRETINGDIQEIIEAIASRLAENGAIGPNEVDFAGSIAAGMVSAYELTGDNSYWISAELAGESILSTASGNFKGDEVFALVCLSQICSDPNENSWRTVLCDFYQKVQNSVDGTEGYISQFASVGPSTAVFNLAYYVIAAYYVDAVDKQIWRGALANYLAQVDNNSSDCPVMLLGIATWALTLTGGLDDTLLDTSGTGAACWNHKKLNDLPAILMEHQVSAGELYAGSFYMWFDHSGDGTGSLSSDYIENTLFATLGLVGAYRENPYEEIKAAIIAARQAIFEIIDTDGSLYPHSDWVYLDDNQLLSAEILQVLKELCISSDLSYE